MEDPNDLDVRSAATEAVLRFVAYVGPGGVEQQMETARKWLDEQDATDRR
jgi:hypothetical protein